jgi:dihydrofolate reductase
MLLLVQMKSIIVAYDKKRGIGADNDLLWLRDLPADLKHFKDVTSGHPIIMGRKTFESIGRPLPNRQNIVVSRSMQPVDGVDVVISLDEAYQKASEGQVFVIGGAQIYAQAIETADEILATEVQATFDNATVFFPEIDAELWMEHSREHHDADEANKYAFDFVRYTRL